MLPSNLWENQTAVARMSFKYTSLSAGDNDPVHQSASEQQKHKHTHKRINAVTSEALLRATSGWLKQTTPTKVGSNHQEKQPCRQAKCAVVLR